MAGGLDLQPELGRPTRSLYGRVAVVTGAGSAGDGIGNGRAAAILLAEDGCKVMCIDLDRASAQRTVDMIDIDAQARNGNKSERSEDVGAGAGAGVGAGSRAAPPRAIAVQADVTQAADVERAVATALDTYGRIDILFNCVGVGGPPGTAVEVDMAGWARGLEINVSSMVLMAKHVVPVMLRNERYSRTDIGDGGGCRGAIINMGSVAGVRGGNPGLLYPTSKGAVVNMTRAMAYHHGGDGIRVNCICPGLVFTPMMYAPANGSGEGMSEAARASRKGRSLLKTEGNAWDVGAAVRFLASDQARWITGLVMEVDAGATVAVGTDLPPGAQLNS